METITIAKKYNKTEAFERFIQIYSEYRGAAITTPEGKKLADFLGITDLFV